MGYTEEDEKIIGEKFDELLEHCQELCRNEENLNLIKKAFFLAKEAHQGVRRRSGEPYILHPLAVALIIVDEIGLGVKSVVASLLHDVVEDTDYTVEDIKSMFGAKIASMVDGLTKMAGVFNTDTSKQAEYFRKVLLTLSDDVRVILIKIADRLHNMRTLGSMPPDKQIKITSETIYLFAPLAYRLGLYSIKTELEDLSLKYRFPDQYNEIVQKLNAGEADRTKFIEKFNKPIVDRLTESGIDFEISGREKSIYSIWSKMQRKQIPFEEVYDLFAIRIVFKPSPLIPEKSQCWHIYSLITDIYKPKPDRIRDWVTIPKANGYEALHATVMGPDGTWAEVQIRSQRMEDIAERGFAAHWQYKQATLSSDEGEFDRWLKQVREALNSPTENAVDFLDNFKLSLYTTEIVVFTPKGETRTLPQGATALDFAYDIHSKIGNRAIGAKINHKIESIFSPISGGDQIEILTSGTAKPTPEWLEHVTTAKAKQSIKIFLKKDKQNNIERGIKIFEEKMHEFGITPSARVFRKVLPAYECATKDEFYSKLGAEIIRLDGLEKILRENSAKKMLKFWSLQLTNPFKFLSGDGKKKGKERDIDASDTEFVIAECCNPIPGDTVMGYRDPSTGKINVHKTSCDELTRLAAQHGENIIPVKWSSHKAMSYLSVIEIRGIDRIGILLDIAQVITAELTINIRELHIQSHDGIFEGRISLYVKNIQDLKMIMDKVRQIKSVEKVKRIIHPNKE
ncbi:MAG: bifunctional (p)ppGpp synthetase/guanosine-3',5'-bis(diphosphate) 3'-pyrophosphohydrolase [Rikenellaceae bacterium]|nr:bifunctional (p)ppGpp synthetase/guanosine-3',5'-bis(diphosphate) 3'-pyrophosphohydrolase [Rikenellaceae bacterium]